MNVYRTFAYGSNPDNANEYEFVCEFGKTRDGFKHVCDVFVNGRRVASASCNYYNRTWECYEYQTVMLRAIEQMIIAHTDDMERAFKREKEYQKMTKKRRAEFNEIMDSDERMIELLRVKGQIRNGFNG